jgi:hypothetical protein
MFFGHCSGAPEEDPKRVRRRSEEHPKKMGKILSRSRRRLPSFIAFRKSSPGLKKIWGTLGEKL